MRLIPVVTGALLLTSGVAAFSSTASAAPTRYEAEVAPATCDGTIDSDWPGYSGTGFRSDVVEALRLFIAVIGARSAVPFACSHVFGKHVSPRKAQR